MKHKLIQILAYLYVPFLFAMLGYSMLYIITAPEIKLIIRAFSMEEQKPYDGHELKTIYNPVTRKKERLYGNKMLRLPIENSQPADNTTPTFNTESVVNIRDIRYPKLGEHFAMLLCERIQLEVPIYWGDTDIILKAGVGQFMGSFLPGFERSILLSAHNTSFFGPLEHIRIGDIVEYNTNYGEYQYIVDEITIMKASEAEKQMEHVLSLYEEKLILYTCYPFQSFMDKKEKRMFVFAKRLTGPRVVK